MRFLPATTLALVSVAALFGSSDHPYGDPSTWTNDDVYRILHNSPWTKTVKVSPSERGLPANNGPGAPTNSPPNNAPAGSMPGSRGGGMGRRGMGGTYSSGSGGSRGSSTSSSTSSAAEVTIQWQSALPVRLAAAKDAAQDVTSTANQPQNEYVVAVIGLPLPNIGGHAASADADAITDRQETEQLQNRLKDSASLLRSGHEPIKPTAVELDQGKDGRILFHFPKTDPIQPKDKTIEFRIATEGTKIEKKFVLKEMEYQGQLQL